MDYSRKIITAFELHSVDEIKECFENGIDPNSTVNGKPLINELKNMYSRGPLFKTCIQTFVDYRLDFEDKILLAVLLDNSKMLDIQLANNKDAISKKYSFDCTFTPLKDVSLLHICAEYNHLECVELLLNRGADVNAIAGFDENGFGGQTAIFHTVNQYSNNSIDVLKLLLSRKANLNITIKGLIWGKGYEWETFIPSINPISYAMMGLLRQFQRTEEQIYEVVSLLIKANYDIDYFPPNIPNKYLKS